MGDRAKGTFVMHAGLFVRRSLIAAVTEHAWEKGLDISHERCGRAIRFHVTGPSSTISHLMQTIAVAFGDAALASPPKE